MNNHEYVQHWDFFYDTSKNCLLQNTGDNLWLEYPLKSNITRTLYFSPVGTSVPPPLHSHTLQRTTIDESPTEPRCEGYSDYTQLPTPSRHPLSTTTLDIRLIKSLGQKFVDSAWALKNIELSPSITGLLQDFVQGKSIMVGDGSYDDIRGFGAGACIISSSDGKEFIITGGPTPGPSSQQNAYRSEIGTLVSMGILAHILAQFTNSCPTVIVACDNDAALERPFLSRSQISPAQKSADLISIAHDIWETAPVSAIPTNVTGHADELNRTLTLLETLNCIVDSKAKQFLSARKTSEINRKGDPHFGLACITMDEINLPGKIAESIQSAAALKRSKEAGIRNKRFNDDTWALLDHRSISRSSFQLSTYKKIFITKWTSKQLPVGSNLTRRRHRLFDTCPMCKGAKEDMAHMEHCPSSVAIQNYYSALGSFSTWLQAVDTDPVIHHHLIAVLSRFRTHPDCSSLPYPCILTKKSHYDIFLEQGTIGWKQFTEGLLSSKWVVLQQNYYNSIHSKRNGMAWASKMIVHLWEINFKVWTHRNTQLHSNSTFLNQLHGQEYLDIAIQKEFCIGKGNLPHTFSPFFYTKPSRNSWIIQ
mmetsp:Transcript_17146/g.32462  ORF Transcript_17146/g.32462 Transcript_17146/m.32462 type:complete len:591 (+) Transcript_17146:2917-4689(+)